MKYYFQSNTGMYFVQDGGNIYSCVEGKNAKKEGKNILKNAFPKPKEIDASEVPANVKAAFKKKMEKVEQRGNMRVEEKDTKTEDKEVIEITEDVRVTGTDVILEKGDKIEVLKERADPIEIPQVVIQAGAGGTYDNLTGHMYNTGFGTAITVKDESGMQLLALTFKQ